MKNFLADSENLFRKFFGVAFPVAITLLLVTLAIRFSVDGEAAKIKKHKDLWSEKAQILLASVRSNHTFEDLVSYFGSQMAVNMENTTDGCKASSLHRFLAHHFPQGFLASDSHVWYFRIAEGDIIPETAPGLSNSRLRVMQKVFSGLYDFSTNDDLSPNQINSHEKFIKGVMGAHSAPLAIGRKREGRLSPVNFEGKRYLLYWRRLIKDQKAVSGILMLFPASRSNNSETILKIVADRVLEDTRNHLAVAFIPVTYLKEKLKAVFPTAVEKDVVYRKNLQNQIDDLQWLTDDKGNKVHENSEHLFLRGFLTADLPYDAVIFAPRPSVLRSSEYGYTPAAAVLFFWFLVYLNFYLKNGRFGLPLNISFRILFLFSGLLPLFVMVSLGLRLIEESYDNELYELRQETAEQLNSLNARSDSLLPLFGYHLSDMLKKPELQLLLNDGNLKDAEKAFAIIRNRLLNLELSLDFLFVFTPGKESHTLIADQRNRQNMRTLANLMAPSVFSINQSLAKLGGQADIKLDPSQGTFHKILSSLPNSFIQDSFFLSYEKPSFVNYGSTGRNYYYTVILGRNGKIASYLIFIARSEQLYRSYLARELATLNLSSPHAFLAAEKLENADFSFFSPGTLQIMQTRTGQTALNFLKKCHRSIFEKHITDRDYLYLFYPLTKMPRYSGGCVISLAGPNQSRNEKRLLLIVAAVLLACLMYLGASLATSHMLLPLTAIHESLQEISQGNLQARIDIERQDELGQLARTINVMLEGFRERIKLGKYVSTTLDRSLTGGTSLEELKKARIISGTVLFSDIRSFTTLSESHPPTEIAQMLNDHLEKMSEQIQRQGGQVEQFIGDAVVAFFPDSSDVDSRKAAVNAAIAMNATHRTINTARQARNLFTYAIGIGLQHGMVMAGSLITPERCEFSITGEARHQAEEFETLSKLGTHSRIIVSQRFLEVIDSIADYEPLSNTGHFELIETGACR